MGDSGFLRTLDPADYTSDTVGLLTVKDIITELDKPGRDPRPEFRMADLKDGVEKIADLKPDMILEGTVTNVTNFGAFVDIGVHQDGLVHISALAERFVKDPRDVVKAGDIVRVKVMDVDGERKRIALTMRLSDKAEEQAEKRGEARRHSGRGNGSARPGEGDSTARKSVQGKQARREKQGQPTANNAFAAAFASARHKK
jgi:uncharacterized protein